MKHRFTIQRSLAVYAACFVSVLQLGVHATVRADEGALGTHENWVTASAVHGLPLPVRRPNLASTRAMSGPP